MRSKALVPIGALLLGAMAATAPAGADSATGGVFVTTLPGGAEIWCDGTYVGRSPLLVDGLAEGRHTIAELKSGWAAQEVVITIVRATVVMASSRLGAARSAGTSLATGTLVLREAPSGARVFLDGVPLAPPLTQARSLAAGTHEIAVKDARGASSRNVTIYPDLATDVILREDSSRHQRSAVVAPAEDYLPTDAFTVAGKRIVVRYANHVVIAHFGETAFRIDGASVDYDSAPETIGGKLYLPLTLLEKLSGDVSKTK